MNLVGVGAVPNCVPHRRKKPVAEKSKRGITNRSERRTDFQFELLRALGMSLVVRGGATIARMFAVVHTQPQTSHVGGVPEKGRTHLQLPQDKFGVIGVRHNVSRSAGSGVESPCELALRSLRMDCRRSTFAHRYRFHQASA